jgi:hypothetical protein
MKKSLSKERVLMFLSIFLFLGATRILPAFLSSIIGLVWLGLVVYILFEKVTKENYSIFSVISIPCLLFGLLILAIGGIQEISILPKLGFVLYLLGGISSLVGIYDSRFRKKKGLSLSIVSFLLFLLPLIAFGMVWLIISTGGLKGVS